MDGRGFDRWTAALAGSPTRRQALGLLGALGLAGVLGQVETDAKHHKKKHKKKDGESPPASPPVCVPEPQTTTCGGNCATNPNNCGQIVTCPCLGTKACLSNGSCATACSGDGDCPSGCICRVGDAGDSHCMSSPGACEQIPQSCTTTAQCPVGTHCVVAACPPGNLTLRCVPVCPG